MNARKPARTAGQLPHMYQDKQQPGIVRFMEDPTAGFLAGMSAAAIVQACNAHNDLVAALKDIALNADDARLRSKARAALTKAGAL